MEEQADIKTDKEKRAKKCQNFRILMRKFSMYEYRSPLYF
jgi:hypothetical protein